MAAEGVFPKSDGDILFGSDYNKSSYQFYGVTPPSASATTVVTWITDHDNDQDAGIVDNFFQQSASAGSHNGPWLNSTTAKLDVMYLSNPAAPQGYDETNDKIYCGPYREIDASTFKFRMTRHATSNYDYNNQLGLSNYTIWCTYTGATDQLYGLTPTTGSADVLTHGATPGANSSTSSSGATYFEVDMGSAKNIDSVSFHGSSVGSSSGGSGSQVQYSTNGSTWTDVTNASWGYASARFDLNRHTVGTVDFGGTSARYFRVIHGGGSEKTRVHSLCAWTID
tara:strand:+ start:1593 stop:2438 length:846 start_codon:yes stop_codon:yes gene_type:complete